MPAMPRASFAPWKIVPRRRSRRRTLGIAALALFFVAACLRALLPVVPTAPDLTGRFSHAPSARLARAPRRLLSYSRHNFTLDARPVRIVSGSVHYFRMPVSRWRPTLLAARRAGLNAVSTYVPWNLHEPRQHKFRWAGMLDLRHFLEIAHQLDLLVFLRPGPYICSEWDFGGLPAYLLADPNMRVRTTYPPFVDAVDRYFDQVRAQITPYIGRPVVAVQLENEFGAYADDPQYMHYIHQAWLDRGLTRKNVLLFTCDNGGQASMSQGSPFDSAHVLKTSNFDWQPDVRLATLRSIQPSAPAMVAEFWAGWFDHWGEKHHTRDAQNLMRDVRDILFPLDASINLYMFFGGTNFGFMAGANIGENMTYQPDTTSYDYDGFLTEFGAVRESKYHPLRAVLREFWTSLGDDQRVRTMDQSVLQPPRLSAYTGSLQLTEVVSLYTVIDAVIDTRARSTKLRTMEEIGGDYGFMMYRYDLRRRRNTEHSTSQLLHLADVRDLAYVLADGHLKGIIDRNDHVDGGRHNIIEIPTTTNQLDIIVENCGRVNYGLHIHDRKGILGGVTLGSELLREVDMFTMSFASNHPLLPDVDGRDVIANVRRMMVGRNEFQIVRETSSPAFFRGTMFIDAGLRDPVTDELPATHCRVYGKGVLWVNGFNVGRFHTGVPGPQRSLLVPGALLREGLNEFMVLHMNMELVQDANLELFEQPDFGS